MNTPPIYFIDLFCGAGGVTTGITRARYQGKRIAKVIACVNHDEVAISSHKENHPEALHFTEDIRTQDIQPIANLVNSIIRKEPDAIICIWASLECTNFSKAKGGKPRDPDSRTLAEHLYRYVEGIKPLHYVWIENVEEFMAWGPLDEMGKPISKKNGTDYLKWVNHICDYGYEFDYRILNSADFGAYTSRKRYFAQFALHGYPITWPRATHAKKSSKTIYGHSLRKWRAVKEVLDLDIQGESIFDRNKPLVENTLIRIYAGLVKYVANGKDLFITKPFSGKPEYKNHDLDGPAHTITTLGNHSLVQPEFFIKYFGKGENAVSVKDPAPTVTTKDRLGLVQTHWLDKTFTGDKNHQSIDGPAGSILTNDKHYVLEAKQFIDRQYSSGGRNSSIDEPIGSILPVPKANLVEYWIMNGNTSYHGSSIDLDAPCPVIPASERKHYLVNPQYASKGGSIEDPAFTLIARMDKMPPYLVTLETGEIAIAVYETDSEIMRKIKIFMAAYGIVDIKMRMLSIPELLRIQGFGDQYILRGTKTDQKRFIGNSVPPKLVKALIMGWYEGLVEKHQMRMTG